MKTLLAVVPFVLAGTLAGAQETTPPREGTRSNEKQFAGEVVSTDTAAKTLTVKTAAPDAKGERVEKTMILAVADDVTPTLEILKAGDKVVVLWKRDDVQKKDVVIKVAKGEPAPPPNQ